jgi:hypothetical protein
MPGPDGIITVYGSFRKAKECEEGEAAFAEAEFFGEEFKEIHAATDPAEMPASKQEVSASPPTFKPTVDIKQVELVARDAAKTTSIGTNLSPKLESALIEFLHENWDIFAWQPSNMTGVPRELTEHAL